MKNIFFIFCLLTGSLFAAAQSDAIEVYILDASGTPTNIRSAPKGKVVDQVPVDGEWVFYVHSPRNGWWQIADGEYYDANPDNADENGDWRHMDLRGSNSGYWVHYSCIGFGLIGGEENHKLRVAPSNGSKVVYTVKTSEMYFHPIALKGEWVKVVSTDGKHTGWITRDMICSNPLTTCP
ncbi:MAG: hypothetical protein J6129_00535 [Bacteroidaceae bacterium]|nr:hypothetical protein [Bacteroidaceae bacterium]